MEHRAALDRCCDCRDRLISNEIAANPIELAVNLGSKKDHFCEGEAG
jgi:hypothetical protein